MKGATHLVNSTNTFPGQKSMNIASSVSNVSNAGNLLQISSINELDLEKAKILTKIAV